MGRIASDLLARTGAVQALLSDMREETTEQDPFLWWESIVDKTTGSIDIEAIRDRGDFTAELVALTDELELADEGVTVFVGGVVSELPLTRLEKLGVNGPDTEDPELWEEAVALAIEMLEGGGS